MMNDKPYTRQNGFTLVEIMIALLIGVFSLIVIYSVFEGSERTRRSIAATNNAQMNGLYSLYLINEVIGGAGSGFIPNGPFLNRCPNDPMTDTNTNDATLSVRPLVAVIESEREDDDGSTNDTIHVLSGTSSLYAQPFTELSAISNFDVTIANSIGLKQDDVVVSVTPTTCRLYRVSTENDSTTGRTPLDEATGNTKITLKGTTALDSNTESLIDVGEPEHITFYVDNDLVLKMEQWRVNDNGSTWQQYRTDVIASNVVGFYAQYGIDDTCNGMIDRWVNAVTSDSGDWSSDYIIDNPLQTSGMAWIRAVRIAIIIQEDEPEKVVAGVTPNQQTVTVFQDCPQADACDGPITRTFNRPANSAVNWKYKKYETVITMKNAVWNAPRIPQ